MINPIEQFSIYPLFDLHWLVTNVALSAVVSTISVMILLLILTIRLDAKSPSILQALAEIFYKFISDCLSQNTDYVVTPYLSFFSTIFLIVLSSNIFGLVPFFATFTSYYLVDLFLATLTIAYITYIGFKVNGIRFFDIFCPPELPFLLKILVFPLELVSYFLRIFSLSIRLCANMIAGHIALHVFANLVILSKTLGVFPFIILFLLTGFEFVIAFLQAFIFLTMCCIYMHDALHPSHH